jgi:hypothetical protein
MRARAVEDAADAEAARQAAAELLRTTLELLRRQGIGLSEVEAELGRQRASA